MLHAFLSVSFLAPAAWAAQVPAGRDADYAAIMRVKAAYEKALNEDDLDKLVPFLGNGFVGRMVTGDRITGARELRAHWDKVKRVIRRGRSGGSYRIRLLPDDGRNRKDGADALTAIP